MHYKFSAPDISCEHCKHRIESALTQSEGVSTAEVHIDEKTVNVEAELAADKLIEIIDEAGYDAELVE
jgi:copper chaperone